MNPVHTFILSTVLLLTLHQTARADMVKIPSGTFQMGCSATDKDCDKDEGPMGGVAVQVPEFEIDSHEVTVAEYTRCIKAGKCNRPKDHARNKYCNIGAPGRDKHPANCVDWQDAADYCAFAGKRLPAEPEWEKAARGETASRYPWGETASCQHAILDDKVTQGSIPNEGDGCGEDRTWPVGSRKPNYYGLFDMQGNAGEWTASWYGQDSINVHYAKGNLNGPVSSQQRVVRGGSWDEDPPNLRASFRNTKPPVSGDTVYGSIGFRCAR